MKYLFVVNSHITALCTKAVIAHENLPHKDVVVLTMRGAAVKGKDLKHIDFIYPHIVNPIPHSRNIFKCGKVLKEFDAFINDVTSGEKFYCYVNHNMARNVELMVNHPNCTGFSILEEGASAYNTKEFFEQKYRKNFPSIWDLIGYRNRIKRRYFHRPDYDKVYAVTPKAFPEYRDKVLLTNVFAYGDIDYSKYNNASIIVLDAIVAFEMIDLASFITGLKKFISILLNKGEKLVYYKFHPAQPKEERVYINNFLAGIEGISFVQLSDEIVLEEMIAAASNLTMYFNVSTVSIYANALGHKCFSFSDILSDISDFYKKRIKNLNETLKASSVQLK